MEMAPEILVDLLDKAGNLNASNTWVSSFKQ